MLMNIRFRLSLPNEDNCSEFSVDFFFFKFVTSEKVVKKTKIESRLKDELAGKLLVLAKKEKHSCAFGLI
jgi:hypothetical protein